MSEELDPDIAAILSSAENYASQSALKLSFSENSEPMDDEQSSKKKSIHNVDLSVKEFAPITKFTNDTPSDVFNDTKLHLLVKISLRSASIKFYQSILRVRILKTVLFTVSRL